MGKKDLAAAKPLLLQHPFFRRFTWVDLNALRQIVHTALTRVLRLYVLIHPCAKLTHKVAAAAAAAAAAAKISARRQHGEKKNYENLENEKITKNIETINEHR